MLTMYHNQTETFNIFGRKFTRVGKTNWVFLYKKETYCKELHILDKACKDVIGLEMATNIQ